RKRLLDTRASRRPALHLCRKAKGEIAADRKMGKEQVVLEQDAGAAKFGWLGFDGAAVEKNAAAHLECGIERAANRGEQARFSRPARPHDGDDLTRLEREGKARGTGG